MIAAVVLTFGILTTAVSSDPTTPVPPTPNVAAQFSDGASEIFGHEAEARAHDARPAATGPVLGKHVTGAMCLAPSSTEASPALPQAQAAFLTGCPAGTVPPPGCPDGTTPVEPLWWVTRPTETAEWDTATLVHPWLCPQDLAVLTLDDFRRLPLAPPVLHLQPAGTQVLVNKPTIVYTDPTTQHLTTTVLGYPLEVEATPTQFTYDWGDDTPPLHTTDPGAPYPAMTTSHPYRHVADARTITLTSTWTGRYRLVGTQAWHDVTGTTTTTTTSTPFAVRELRTYLTDTDHAAD